MRKILRNLALITILALGIVACGKDEITTTTFSGKGTSESPYLITKEGNLTYISQQVQGGNTYEGEYFKLAANINLENISWTPIGTNDSCYFAGTFDGDIYTISNLLIDSSDEDYQGLFGYVSGATIKNLTLDNASVKGVNYVGAICGYMTSLSSVENCGVINSYVTASSRFVAGLVGCANESSTITDCYNTADVVGNDYYVAGIVGQTDSNISGCYNTGLIDGSSGDYYMGGITGCASSSSSVSDCYNTGTVKGGSEVGGIAGYAVSSKVIDCYNTGDIEGSGSYVGGLVGYAYSCPITNCYNTGSVKSNSISVGGIVGRKYSNSPVIACYSTGTIKGSSRVGGIVGHSDSSVSIIACYNTGSVTGDNDCVGGVVGRTYNTTITACYNLGTVSGASDYGGVMGFAYDDVTDCYYYPYYSSYNSYATYSETLETKMKGTEIITTLNDAAGSTYFEQDTNSVNDSYPILVGIDYE